MQSLTSKKLGIGMTSMRTRQRLIERLRQRGIENETLLQVIESTPRHLFVNPELSHKAYEDTALPIGYGQTISQPFIVALMTQLLLQDSDTPRRILEIGTGCGYQTAILSQLAKWVFTIERIEALCSQAKQRLPDLGYRNISCLCADGFFGWQSNQPFDGILVAAAPQEIPQDLLNQLAIDGKLVIPVGDGNYQSLRIVTRKNTGFYEQVHETVKFVPMLQGEQKF